MASTLLLLLHRPSLPHKSHLQVTEIMSDETMPASTHATVPERLLLSTSPCPPCTGQTIDRCGLLFRKAVYEKSSQYMIKQLTQEERKMRILYQILMSDY